MGTDEAGEALAERVRRMRWLVFGFAGGAALVLGVAYAVRAATGQPPPDGPRLAFLYLFFAIMLLGASLVLPDLVAAPPRRDPQQEHVGDPIDWIGLYRLRLTVGCGMLAFGVAVNAVGYMLEGSALSLAVGGMLVGLVLLRFPTQHRVQAWIDQRREVER